MKHSTLSSSPNNGNTHVGGSTYSKTFRQDIFGPLDEVQRVWLRRTGTILMTPLIVALGIVAGILELSAEWYRRCW